MLGNADAGAGSKAIIYAERLESSTTNGDSLRIDALLL